MAHPPLAEVTLTLRDTPEGGVTVHTTFKPALGQRLTPAQALALDLSTQASHRAEVVHLQVQQADDTEAARAFDAHTLSLPLEPLQ
jgi:hypothetical protein